MIKMRVRGWCAGAGTVQSVGGSKKQGRFNNNYQWKLIFSDKRN